MSATDHDRARDLAAERMMRPLAEEERRWLDAHLAGCPRCSAELERLGDAVTAFRTVPVRADAALVSATRRAARVYADRLRETETRDRLLLLSSAVAGACSVLTLPWLWRAATFVADRAWLPDPAPLLLAVVLWTLPGAIAAVLLVAHRRSTRLHAARSLVEGQNGWEES